MNRELGTMCYVSWEMCVMLVQGCALCDALCQLENVSC